MLSVQALSTKTRRVMFLFQRAAKEHSLLLHDTLTVAASSAEKDLRCAKWKLHRGTWCSWGTEAGVLENAHVSGLVFCICRLVQAGYVSKFMYISTFYTKT